MTEEMVGGQHRSDESDTEPRLLGWTPCRPTIADAPKHKASHVCAQRRPTPHEKTLATADLIRDGAL